MNFQDLISKLSEIEGSVSERVTIGPDGQVTGGFQPSGNPAPAPAPAEEKPAVVPLNKRFDPRYKPGPENYTIDIDGKIYKWAGRAEAGTGKGEIIKIPAALVGIRGLGAVSVELGADGMYRAVPANESQDMPLDEVAQLRKSLGLDYFVEGLDECNMPGDMVSPPKQSDSVSMNVSLNASGSGGIKDLMSILKGIEDGGSDVPHDAGKDVIIGNDDFPFDEEFANAPEELYAPPEAVIPTGDDLHSKGVEAPKVNGGGNPMQESLKARLSELYNEVKNS